MREEWKSRRGKNGRVEEGKSGRGEEGGSGRGVGIRERDSGRVRVEYGKEERGSGKMEE